MRITENQARNTGAVSWRIGDEWWTTEREAMGRIGHVRGGVEPYRNGKTISRNAGIRLEAFASLLAKRATEMSVDHHGIAQACEVSAWSSYHWWYGERIPNRHAGAIRSLLGAEAQAAIWASFPPRLGSGRRAADGGRLTLVRAARVLRGHGEHELAARVAARAEAIGEAGR